MRISSRAIASLAQSGLSATDYRVYFQLRLDAGSKSREITFKQTDLAKKMGLRPQHLNRSLGVLVKTGIIEKLDSTYILERVP